MWLDGLDGGDKIFFTTGRLTSEMVIKTAQMGIPFLISRSGTTQMGWEIARQTGITMIGRVQGRHYLVYTGTERSPDERGFAGRGRDTRRRIGPAHGRSGQGPAPLRGKPMVKWVLERFSRRSIKC